MAGRLRILTVSLLIAGCGSAAGSPTAATTPTPSGSTVAVVPIPSTAGSSSAVLQSAPARPTGPVTATFDDPDATIQLPDGWQTAPASELRKQVEQGVALGPSDAIKRAYQGLLTDIDADWVRLFAFGPSGFAPWQGTLTIEVTDAKSIEAQIDRVTALEAAFAKPKTSEETKVTLPIGSGVRLEQTADPPDDLGPGLLPHTVSTMSSISPTGGSCGSCHRPRGVGDVRRHDRHGGRERSALADRAPSGSNRPRGSQLSCGGAGPRPGRAPFPAEREALAGGRSGRRAISSAIRRRSSASPSGPSFSRRIG